MPEGFATVDDLVVSVTGDVTKFRGSLIDVKSVLEQFSSSGVTGISGVDAVLSKMGGTAAGVLGRIMPLLAAAQSALQLYETFKTQGQQYAEMLGLGKEFAQVASAYDDLVHTLTTVVPGAYDEMRKAIYRTRVEQDELEAEAQRLPSVFDGLAQKVVGAFTKPAEELAHAVRTNLTSDETWSFKTIEKELQRLQELFAIAQERIQRGMASGQEGSIVGRMLGLDEAMRDLNRLMELMGQIQTVTEAYNAKVARVEQWKEGTAVTWASVDALEAEVRSLQLKAATLGMAAGAAAKYTAEQRAIWQAEADGIAISEAFRAALAAKTDEIARHTDRIKAWEEADRKRRELERKAEQEAQQAARREEQADKAILKMDNDLVALRQKAGETKNLTAAQIAQNYEERMLLQMVERGLPLNDERRLQIKAASDAYGELTVAMREAQDRMRMLDEIGGTVTRSMAGVFKQWANGAKVDLDSVRESARSLLVELSELVFRRMVLDQLASGISGGLNSVGNSISGVLFGGAREGGGPVEAGKAYIVGERRPELFVPDRSGVILPSVPRGASGGGVNVQVNYSIDASGAYPESIADLRRAMAEQEQTLPQRIVSVVGDAKERGGL